ncbi:hypothetical protein [Phenylobacterium sp.]|uniref:hypothetical protein n=1 Tax=Phenylobacterium sp. TaxID=1871053 RepID=UPI0028985D33|nr:hypothetical protein [Phenylobacterium sp.]
MRAGEFPDIESCIRHLEGASRSLLRTEASGFADRFAPLLQADTGDVISLTLALLGDYRHAKALAERLLPTAMDWSITPSPEGLTGKTRAARYLVVIGGVRASSGVASLALIAALLRRAGGDEQT